MEHLLFRVCAQLSTGYHSLSRTNLAQTCSHSGGAVHACDVTSRRSAAIPSFLLEPVTVLGNCRTISKRIVEITYHRENEMTHSRNYYGILAIVGFLAIVGAHSLSGSHSPSALPIAIGTAYSEGRDWPVLTAASFGFQCGTGLPTNCPNETWPATVAQPGMIRLWASQVQWHAIHSAPDSYKWKTLDGYLDVIAAHQPRAVIYTFGFTPCWDTKGECEIGWGSISPPSDLTDKGSPSFNAFVNALVDHCSPAGHCVKDYIKYWEMWNEANGPHFWSGSIHQLYDLMAPSIPIIRKKVPGALVLTPPPNRGDTDWMRDWLVEENKRGRLSDIYSFHLYLQGQAPETRFQMIKDMIELKNSTKGWADTPWMNTETNFDASTFRCSTRFSAEDCLGQLVRWHLLHFSYGADNLNWYFFNTTIGRNPEFSNIYHTMMEWLVDGRFEGECAPSGTSSAGTIVTCPFLEGKGRHALFIWNFGGSNTYTPTAQYIDYKTLAGSTIILDKGKPVMIGAKPIMLEAAY